MTFIVCLWPLSIRTMEHAIIFEAFSWMWEKSIALYTSEYILILLLAVKPLMNSSYIVPFPPSHTITLPPTSVTHHVVHNDLDHELFLSWSTFFSSHLSDTVLSWFHPSKESDSRPWESFFRCCLEMSNLAFLFLNVASGLHLVVNSRIYIL